MADRKQIYEEYLASELWKEIRARILKRDFNLCKRCGDLASQVHHRDYKKKTLAGKNDSALWSLCGGCHRFISRNRKGRARSQKQTERLLWIRPWGSPIK